MEKVEGQQIQGTEPEYMDYSFRDYMGQLFNTQGLKEPTYLTQSLVNYAALVFCVTCTLVIVVGVTLGEEIFNGDGRPIAGLVITFLTAFVNIVVIARQPQSDKKLSFKVPFVPWLPAFSSLVNIYLMFNLSSDTWIRFGIWMGVGLPLYFLYGYRFSRADDRRTLYKQEGHDNLAGPSHTIPDSFKDSEIKKSSPNTPVNAPDRYSLSE
ncbi:High affinity cationic amino acid transporter 1 [Halocaridina rubra]|uniref:High affinity cationic amino acid transporter 1 n=1 Tax=Halocaridina rubra TaxID=373956 RepID=A0AAN8X2N5_HALRR